MKSTAFINYYKPIIGNAKYVNKTIEFPTLGIDELSDKREMVSPWKRLISLNLRLRGNL